MHRWRGKVAVVTGASSGIGSAIAVELVKAGMIVVGLARRVELIEKLQEQLPSGGIGKLHAIHCDLTDDADIRQAFSDIYAKIGVVHVLVNNAGIAPVTNVTDEGNDDVLKNVIQTNLWATVLCTKQAVEIMKLQNVIGGHIININSCSGHEVFETGFDRPCLNLYPATKHGITALTEVLSKEFRSDDLGYKVTSISPGSVRTNLVDAQVIQHMPMDYPELTAEDVAKAVVYVLETPKHVVIGELKIKPMGEMF